MPLLDIQIQELSQKPPAALVTLDGPIDNRTIGSFQSHLDLLTQSGLIYLVFGMEKVPYVNSTGLHALVTLSDELKKKGGRVILVGLQHKVRVVLDMLGVASIFEHVSSRQAALLRVTSAGRPSARRGPPKKHR